MIRKVALLCLGIGLVAVSRVQAAPTTHDEILRFVARYIDANNKADATAVMEMTSRKANVSSVEMGTITRGWEAIRNSADAAIGSPTNDKLTLGVVDVQELGPSYALAVAPFSATTSTTQGDVQVRGALTLVLERTTGKWKMLHEHASIELPGADKAGE